jgi:hypothetical protein
MALDYWVLVPKQSEMNVTGVVADAFIVSVQQGSAIDKQLLSNYTGRVTIDGRSGYQRAGPFTTLAAAQAYLKVGAQNAASPVPGVDITPSGGLAVVNPLDWLAKVTGFSGTNFVLRAIKIVIGGVLLISGIVHLSGIDKAALGVAGKGIIPA